ncbi:MAG: hypothetical protein JWQ96_1899 [Segetibacter sp.]|nr:hypothetical protein [Segetibacter sp.]
MNNEDNKPAESDQTKYTIPSAEQMAQNPNPRANENIRIGTEDPQVDEEAASGVGSEITDGESG